MFNRLRELLKRRATASYERRRNRALVAIAKSNQKMGVRLAALLLSSSTLISALLGIYRDRLLNSMYLDTYKVGIDAYTVAFSIPDFMYLILVSLSLIHI